MEKIYLDEETKKALMGLAPFSSEVNFDYTPKYYEKRGVKLEFRPVYSLRVFVKSEQDQIIADIRDGKKLYEITRKIVMGWKNVIDIATSETLEYKGDKNGADESTFGRISKIDRDSIFQQVSLVSGIIREESLGLES